MPSHVTRAVLKALAPCLSNIVPLISATKGIEEDTSKLMTQIMEEVLPAEMAPYIMALSGPELRHRAQRRQAHRRVPGRPRQRDRATVSTGLHDLHAARVCGYGSARRAVGRRAKNVMALAAGVVDGLGLGLNARAALITRGLAEIIRLAWRWGGPRRFTASPASAIWC